MNLRNDIAILTILFQFKKYSHKNDCINKNTHTKYIITNKHFPTGYSHNHLYQTEKTIQASKCHRKHQNIQYNTPNGLFHLCLQGFNTIRNIPLCHTIKRESAIKVSSAFTATFTVEKSNSRLSPAWFQPSTAPSIPPFKPVNTNATITNIANI